MNKGILITWFTTPAIVLVLTCIRSATGMKKAEQSREITLKMLREQDRKERRKLMNIMSEKLPKGVKVYRYSSTPICK